uniref:Uncharacterized protein LOC110213441 n=1 Tax=Phascolarctos cinereus TaxID=38626 RepID=A0A6P5KW14_PHACI|nr:uncharacterized protein LOC110213441 [Phascolarctos cinereus]
MKTFHNSLEKRQIFFMEEKENSVTWAVVWTDPRTTTHEMYHKDICAVQNYIWSKEETEPLQEELILGDMNKKVQELYQHLKELEATQEYQIMKQKEAWEAMIATENRILMEGIKELAEKVRKPNVQVIQEFTQVSDVLFPRLYKYEFFHFFSPKFHHLYYFVVNEFLYYFQTLGLSQGYNRYNLSEDKKTFIITIPDSSGKTYAIYVTGSVELETMMLNIIVNPVIQLKRNDVVGKTLQHCLNTFLHG